MPSKWKGGADLDLYMAMFKHLAGKADLDLDFTETAARFVGGLQEELKSRIIRRDTLPSTLTEWMIVAQEDYRHRARVRAEMLQVEACSRWRAVLPLVSRGAEIAVP